MSITIFLCFAAAALAICFWAAVLGGSVLTQLSPPGCKLAQKMIWVHRCILMRRGTIRQTSRDSKVVCEIGPPLRSHCFELFMVNSRLKGSQGEEKEREMISEIWSGGVGGGRVKRKKRMAEEIMHVDWVGVDGTVADDQVICNQSYLTSLPDSFDCVHEHIAYIEGN